MLVWTCYNAQVAILLGIAPGHASVKIGRVAINFAASLSREHMRHPAELAGITGRAIMV